MAKGEMMKLIKLFLGLAILGSYSVMSLAEFDIPTEYVAAENALSEEDIQTEVIGNTTDGGDWAEFYASDGTIVGHYKGNRYKAKWMVEGQVMCFEYKGGGWEDVCRTLSLDGNMLFYHDIEEGISVGGAQLKDGKALN